METRIKSASDALENFQMPPETPSARPGSIVGMYHCPTQGEEHVAIAQQLQVVKSADTFVFFGSLGADQNYVNLRFQKLILTLVGHAKHQRGNAVPVRDHGE